MYYLNVNGVIKAYATQEDYQKAAAAQAAVSYPEFPLIQLSDETITHILQRDGGECVELDGLRTPALYRVSAETPLGTGVSMLSVELQPSGEVKQTMYNCDFCITRATADGVWQGWGIILFYSKADN